MRIAIDAMGGDHAPEEIIKGAIEAKDLLDADDEIVLIGDTEIIRSHLESLGSGFDTFRIIHAPEVIGMDEPPVESLRKKRKSSIAVMARSISHKQVDAALSAGNTGACVAGCQLRIKNLEGVQRPGIAVVLPTFGGPVTMCDVGANIACRPGVSNPRVGLMSIGSEEAKGNEIVKKTRELLKSDSNINFIGNVEGRDILDGTCDVAICEGFVGNVILKLTEGLVDGLFGAIKQELMQKNLKLAMKFKPIMTEIYKKYDYHEYGGALMLGVNGTAVICHGSSKARTIKNALLASKKFCSLNVNEKIVEYLSQSSARINGE
jgi:glycerol-3-phosphate acyltransferase PlsX